MKNRALGLAGIAVAALFLNLPCRADETKAGSPPQPATPAAKGEFMITPVTGGLFSVDANDAPVIPLLNSIAQRANRKIIFSDEATAALNKNISVQSPGRVASADKLMDILGRALDFSWGTFGQDTYLVVMNTGAAERSAEKKKAAEKLMQERLDERQKQPKTTPEPERKTSPSGRPWFLSPARG
jgi:hypothetical protein